MTESVWGPVKQEMSDLLQTHPDDVPAVVDQLTKLQDILGRVPPLLHTANRGIWRLRCQIYG